MSVISVELAQKNAITKYLTLKYFRYGELSKREYRGSRQVEPMAEFVRKNLAPVFERIDTVDDFESKIDMSKQVVLIYLHEESEIDMKHLQKLGAGLRDDCRFYLGIGEKFSDELKSGSTMVFRPAKSGPKDEMRLSGPLLQNFTYLREWIIDKCVPLVREITFENAEELTEEGLPFLILFKKPDDTATLDVFTQQVATELMEHRGRVNFWYADGLKFAHPLHHLGKSTSDLPLIAIDSFRHMYLFPDMKKLAEPGVLRQFLVDLYSGKLHREMHYGPDPTKIFLIKAPTTDQHLTEPDLKKSTPPSSVFQKLKPSLNRYTILRDEL